MALGIGFLIRLVTFGLGIVAPSIGFPIRLVGLGFGIVALGIGFLIRFAIFGIGNVALSIGFPIRVVGFGLGIVALGIGSLTRFVILGSESWVTFPYYLLTMPLSCPYHAFTMSLPFRWQVDRVEEVYNRAGLINHVHPLVGYPSHEAMS